LNGPNDTPKPDARITGATLTFGEWRARPMLESDADLAFTFLNDPGVTAARTRLPPQDFAGALAWVNDALSDAACVPWILESANDAGSAGFIALQSFDPTTGVAEIGFLVMPSARRKGLATKALRAVTEWAFATLDIHRVYLVHDTSNEGSCKAAVSAGYAIEGTCRSSRPRPDGTRADSELHARLRTDGETTA
jgi:RimJ/RimL family protein N-acetyltransferase